MKKLRVVVVGCGHMGASHARAYHALEFFELAGIVSIRQEPVEHFNAANKTRYPYFPDLTSALANLKPDAVAICTYPDTHEQLAAQALNAGVHVFLEKPMADTVEGARRLFELAKKQNKKLLVGYILQHHPSWIKFVELARTLGKPLVMRMNLNQQSHGKTWETHKKLLKSLSPVVDCGVHYVDIMCRMTGAKPVRVSGIAARLSRDIAERQNNYGQLQVCFDDGSVGWYEAAWGPMVSTNAFFVKDVFGPNGSVSIVAAAENASDDIDAHTKTNALRLHSANIAADGNFERPDEWIYTSDEPTHDALCRREQAYFYKAITEDLDLTQHLTDAVNSLKIVLAADESARTGKTIIL